MKKFLFNRTTFLILFALIAMVLMGSTFAKPVSSDLHKTAQTLVNERSSAIRSNSSTIAARNPGAILRANVIK